MVEATGAPMAKDFAASDGPGIYRTNRHKLLDIITIAICGTICGADSWADFELFGIRKEEWFRSFLELPNGIPSHDTFGDVFARLDPEQFQRCFIEWVQSVARATQGEAGPMDGKAERRSQDRTLGKHAIQMVNVWASANSLALGQAKVEKKSNEITAISKLLQLLDLTGCIVTVDATGGQIEIAQKIVEARADYLLAVKKSQGQLYDDVRDLFEGAEEFDYQGIPHDFARTVHKNHGRLETRKCWVISDPYCLEYLQDRQQWANLNTVVKVTVQRKTATETTVQTRYYISSLAGPAKKFLEATSRYWGIGNSLHWSLDVTFREDHNRVRKDHGPQNLVVLRRIALNLLEQETTLKQGIQDKQARAERTEDYLLEVPLG
jgi:predicted transposase YbfD/YdcC